MGCIHVDWDWQEGGGGIQREGEGKKIKDEERMKLENSIHHVLLSSTVTGDGAIESCEQETQE